MLPLTIKTLEEWLPGVEVAWVEEIGRCWSKGTNFEYKMNKFSRSNVQHDDHS